MQIMYIQIMKRAAMKYDLIKSETDSDIENTLDDSDTEEIAEGPIPDYKEESHQLLTPETAVHVEGKAQDIDEPPAKTLKKESH